ncbi:MAG: 3-mercaptopyruvate sulfurtransferase [Pseudomonadota bacterium]
MASADPLVTAQWLLDHIDQPDLQIIDATWVPPFVQTRPSGAETYLAGHLPGAVFFDIDAIADQTIDLSHMLPSSKQFGAQVGALGIGDDLSLVVYDDHRFFASARVWWMFRAMGYKDVRVLDGGLAAWRALDGTVEQGSSKREPRAFQANSVSSLTRDVDEMRAHVQNADRHILDARDPGRFNGTAPEPRAGLPSGHMPGSFCIPVSSLIDEGGMMKSLSDLKSVLQAHLAHPIVTSCGSGVSAAVIALALARLGRWDAAVYDGSWSEWAADPQNPIARRS